MRYSAMTGLAALVLLVTQPAHAEGPAGRYRLTGEQDVASELILMPDGRFAYMLMAGSLDEQAQGRWTADGRLLRLVTLPQPVAPVFSAGSVTQMPDAGFTLHVTGPNGRGIAAVDVTVGFDSGEPVEGYTQEYGWSLSGEERRMPRWAEFSVPIYALRSQRFPIDATKGNDQTFILTPNDIGTIDFRDIIIEVAREGLIVHRYGALLRYEAMAAGEE